MDIEMLIKIGWTALLGWNLKETVGLGKKVASLETKLANGIFQSLNDLKQKVESHIADDEQSQREWYVAVKKKRGAK
jgi:hypothetical protein